MSYALQTVIENPNNLMRGVLRGDLAFTGVKTDSYTHRLHPFAAKFPPQLPRYFIEALTREGEVVLDPMMGSGTCLVESLLLGRKSIGFDIDPLALLISKVKTTPLDPIELYSFSNEMLDNIQQDLFCVRDEASVMYSRLGTRTEEFINYWFDPDVIAELQILKGKILSIEKKDIRDFFIVVFSSVIITKSGGVSRARDLAHSRPHRVYDKPFRSPIQEFRKKAQLAIKSMGGYYHALKKYKPVYEIQSASADKLPLPDNCIDIIVTSPPYANAIDYMRAHKFSLVWMGYTIEELSRMRSDSIGSEKIKISMNGNLSDKCENILSTLKSLDQKKEKVIRQYFFEMGNCLKEMARVLKNGKYAVIVVGTSTIRGFNVLTHECLASLGEANGLLVVGIVERPIDRDKRMLPMRRQSAQSRIEQRMQHEYVIGFLKP
ncbi:MAG: DNA methyltransferase [Candidatus Sumerlaeota bacterium]|nr:DNA methyltransferase [Candidatus Sumerlaeota bacterium]